MPVDFLESETSRPWTSDRVSADCELYLGKGSNGLEILVTECDDRPQKSWLQRLYTDRRNQRINPILVIVLRDDSQTVDIIGPAGEDPDVKRDLEPSQVERICESALERPDHHAAQRFLSEVLAQIEEELVGLRNQGLLSTHELKSGVPDRPDWEDAVGRAKGLLDEEGRNLVEGLGYEIERLQDHSYILKDTRDGREQAVAVFLNENESFDHAQDRFTGQTPVSYALNEADKKNLDYVIASSDNCLRLYTTNPDAGFGSRGRTDTFVEVNTDLLTDDNAGYLPLLFSSRALQDDGSLHEIMSDSKDYATELGRRLRERIYDDVVPDLAESIAEARNLENPTKDELDGTYRMALIKLYRLLFIAYAEDEGFLPRHNPRYERRSLKAKAHELHDLRQEDIEFDDRSTAHWDDVMELSHAIHNGHSEWGLPEYNGRLLSSDDDISEAGAQLAEIELTDNQFGPVLANLLIDESEADDIEGPVDFRNIGVREFGVIYEGLLESELSLADQDLTVDNEGHYTPINPTGQQQLAENDADVVVEEGEVYLHGQSGERKATGTYYTKTRFVEHLLDHSLEPALDDHLERLDRLREEEGRTAAAEAFFDFRVSDIAMGSGHFLVGAVDRIENRLMKYLTRDDVHLPQVEEELDRLRDAAEDAFASSEEMPEVERSQLLRRQVARRCIYGVDVNDLSTELARLSLWVHTFVPGLPLAFLDYNLTTGDSLAGIGTLDEVSDILDVEQTNLEMFMGGSSVVNDIEDAIDELGSFADADAQQVAEARETREEIQDQLAETRAAFDILAASRVEDEIDPSVVNSDDTELLGSDEYERAQDVFKGTNQLHFPIAFPEVFNGDNPGFDVLLGNPPWEKTKVEKHEFWARHYPGLRSMTQPEREAEISELEKQREDLVDELEKERLEQEKKAKILINGPYPGLGSGDPDLYQAFSWQFWRLIKTDSHLGVVLPREAFLSKGSESFRRHILESGKISDITFILNNRQWAFEEVHPQTTIGLFSARKDSPSEDTWVPIRGPYPSREAFDDGVQHEPHYFELRDVLDWTETASFPLLPPNPGAIEAFDQIQQSPAVVNADRDDWNVVPYRTGITSSDCLSESEASGQDGAVWPVYKGESFDIWDPDTGSYYGWGNKEKLVEYLQDKRSRSRKWPDTDRELPCFTPTIAFRRVTRATDRRTVRVSLIPPKVFMRDADPVLLWESGDSEDEAYLIGVLSSIPTDWYARRFVEKHLDYYIFNGVPIPHPDGESILRKRAIELSGRLAAIDDRYEDWANEIGVDYGPLDDDEKQEKIHELDAVVAHLYGLSRENLQVVFETFHDNWDHERRMNAVLEHYDEWAEQLEDKE
ncbi:hypothetical protein C491_20946 [Natronococcus amylolyticus DSM 10524]|uniref:site-specific DNA-methyltransferase (adenine-specific) n=1 Tax=Natronococcus amylolyticus DSM 10524 TaxID=1227497 RepID=L9WW60_9EURY|nr:hypothetical protein [Natronococcus amylolyticus]ELY53647.1 hypothetical protein C491_20946 [Natronococcus amylolyticus DSM 10524]